MLKFLAISLLSVSFSMAQAASKVDGVQITKTADGKTALCAHPTDVGSADYRALWASFKTEGDVITAYISLAALTCSHTDDGFDWTLRKFNDPVQVGVEGNDPTTLFILGQTLVWRNDVNLVIGSAPVPNQELVVIQLPIAVNRLLTPRELESIQAGQTVYKSSQYYINGMYKYANRPVKTQMSGGAYTLSYAVSLDESGKLRALVK